ncbi:MAG: ribosome biogenesis factor YjgA [Polynucleobacter sp.]|nr:ribosome biogenesis factor YjgA [Polynucleobacter sp.]
MPLKPEDDDSGPSKSELKREMTERQKLAETLSKLSNDALKSVPLDDSIRDAIAQTSKIKTFEALRRHKQYLGKLMRALDAEEIAAIEKRLEVIEGPGKVETAKLHQLEAMRNRLLEDDGALTALIERCPDMDVQNIRTLIRNARKEKELNKPPKAYREIFQILRDLEC